MPQVEFFKPVHRKLPQFLRLTLISLGVLVGIGYLAWRLVPSASVSVKQADALNDKGSYAASYGNLRSAYSRAIFPNDKALVLSRLAPAAEDSGDNDASLRYYQDLNRTKPNNLPTLLAMGDLADRLGRSGVEVQAYSQAVELMKTGPKGPSTQDYIDTLEAKLQELQK
jgi:tetratricopeptide (TPR) repeat protein